jgi:hypothetical protein
MFNIVDRSARKCVARYMLKACAFGGLVLTTLLIATFIRATASATAATTTALALRIILVDVVFA